jgi:colicin import membrane protein
MSERDDTLLAFGGSVLLHAGIVAVVMVALWLKPTVEPADVAGPVIEAVLVDFTAPPLLAAASKPTPPKPQAPKPAPPPPPPQETMTPAPAQDTIDQEKVRLAAEALEKAEREQEERRKQEQVDLDRQDELTQMERERQRQLDDIRKLREEAEKKRKLEEMKLAQLQQKDAEQRRQAEQQRMDQLAAQEAQRAGTNGRDDSLKGQYILAISQWADRNWRRPDTLQEGFRCMLTVKQIPGGDVIEVNSSRCAGDPLVIRSVEAAVQREPLPYRGFESVFERIVTIPFCYPREICIQ